MAFRRRLLGLDKLVLGASPEKLAAAEEHPAAAPTTLTDEQQRRLHALNFKLKAQTITTEERLERDLLMIKGSLRGRK